MSNSKDAVSVCLIDHVLPGGSILQKLIPELLHRPHPPRGQHRFPGAQLLILQPSPSQLSQLLQSQFLVGRISRHVAAGTKEARHGAPLNEGPVTYARFPFCKATLRGHLKSSKLKCDIALNISHLPGFLFASLFLLTNSFPDFALQKQWEKSAVFQPNYLSAAFVIS